MAGTIVATDRSNTSRSMEGKLYVRGELYAGAWS